ncbi:MAG: hypothetical protein QM742_08560 [Aquabacterium sp.]
MKAMLQQGWRKSWMAACVGATVMFVTVPIVHAAVSPERAEQIMQKSGLWDQLGSVLPQARVGMSAAFSLGESEPSLEEADLIDTALEAAYGTDRLRRLGLAQVARSLDEAQVQAMQRWFDSPLARKLADVEKAASSRQTDLREVMKQGSDVFDQLPPARQALLRQMLKETRSDEAMVEVAIHTLVGTYRGVAAARPEAVHLGIDEVKATLNKERQAMLASYAKLILASFAQAYAPLSDAELRQYVAFLGSPVGRRHTDLALRSLRLALDDGEAWFVRLAPQMLKTGMASVAASAPAAAPR